MGGKTLERQFTADGRRCGKQGADDELQILPSRQVNSPLRVAKTLVSLADPPSRAALSLLRIRVSAADLGENPCGSKVAF